MRRHWRPLVAVVVAAVLLVPALALSDTSVSWAQATTTAESDSRQTVVPGLQHRRLSLRLDDGSPAVANVLSFKASDPALELSPELGGNRIPGSEPVHRMGTRLLDQGGVAGINGNFGLFNNPPGDPDGFYAEHGTMESEARTQGGGPRGAVAEVPGGGLLMDRFATHQTIAFGSGHKETLAGVNRHPSQRGPHPDGPDPVVLYTPRFGSSVDVRRAAAGSPVRALVLDGVRPPVSGASGGTVGSVHQGEGRVPIPANGSVVVAHGGAANRLAGVGPGESAVGRVAVQPARDAPGDWAQAQEGLAGGPLIVKNGQMTDPDSWFHEGFSPRHHTHVRHPRSAIGWTGDGRVLLVTVDGRDPGRSVGMTMHELAHLLRQLGAVRGLSLDGGGSTQMAVNGHLTNQPCCDQPVRGVPSGLFVHYRSELPQSACPEGDMPDSGFADTRGNAHERAIDCVAWYEVARGVDDDTYAPAELVRRDQMASFVVRLMAVSGVEIPEPRDQGFSDIEGNPHADRINQLSQLGVAKGTSPRTYSPTARIRRDQMASFLVRAFERIHGSPLDAPASGFGDIRGNPHKTQIDKSRAAGFTHGTSGRVYRPAGSVRRDQMASFLARALTRGFEHGYVSHPSRVDEPLPDLDEPLPDLDDPLPDLDEPLGNLDADASEPAPAPHEPSEPSGEPGEDESDPSGESGGDESGPSGELGGDGPSESLPDAPDPGSGELTPDLPLSLTNEP